MYWVIQLKNIGCFKDGDVVLEFLLFDDSGDVYVSLWGVDDVWNLSYECFICDKNI